MEDPFVEDRLRPTFDLEGDTTRLILVAGRVMESLGRRSFAPHGLTISDVAPLTVLEQFGPLTPSQLRASSPLLSSPQVVSHSVNRIVEAGFATRKQSDTDGRSVVIEITDRGREIVDRLLLEVHDFSAEFLGPLSEDEVVQLRDMLERCLSQTR